MSTRCQAVRHLDSFRTSRDKYMTVFSHPDLTLQDLQEQATSKPGLGQPEDELGGIALRSVFWRIYLGTLDISQVLSTAPRAFLRESLQKSRALFDTARRKWLISPDGRWATDCTKPDGDPEVSEERGSASLASSGKWDPLNLGESVCRLVSRSKRCEMTRATLHRTRGRLGFSNPNYGLRYRRMWKEREHYSTPCRVDDSSHIPQFSRYFVLCRSLRPHNPQNDPVHLGSRESGYRISSRNARASCSDPSGLR